MMNGQSLPVLDFAALADAGRALDLPVNIALPVHTDACGRVTLRLERLLRVLPGRRYVGEGLWNGQKVLAKLFVGPKAARHLERERQGALRLATEGLNTPRLLADGKLAGTGGWLLFEFLEAAESLGERWRKLEQQPPSPDVKARQATLLGAALRGIAALHARGLWQEDLHLDNLLDQQGRLYLIDGAGIRAENPGAPLSQQKTLENLGLFFAQLPLGWDTRLKAGLEDYLQANPASAPFFVDLTFLQEQVDRARRWRIRDLMKKIGRDCALFSVKKTGLFGAFGFCAVRRDEADILAPLLEHPDAFIARGQLCKAGGTATVVKVDIAGRSWIIKRYNIKHFRHWLRRFWRPSRAWAAWREGNRLMALGVATAKPLAVIERRWLWLRGTAFLVTEYLEGQDIMAHFQPDLPPETAPTRLPREWTALRELFAVLRQGRVSHGDFKGHNLIWQAGEQGEGRWALIDLDAMRQYRSASCFAHAYARDRDRFLRNWPKDCPLYRWLDDNLPR
jgi:tRNA A-37 threonylcarbamoyl transferase component Bud32